MPNTAPAIMPGSRYTAPIATSPICCECWSCSLVAGHRGPTRRRPQSRRIPLVDQLIEAGAVTRSRSTSDRRIQIIELTDRGRELLAASTREAANLDAAFRTSLSPAGRAALDTLLLDLGAHHPVVTAGS